ncbi:hypothetical protein AB1484_12585 [Parafrankia sp. FMc6]|uniref:hypothetical protein n=1 Tax=Parafrankia soli TaxID=2599596 RepID=UPI0034D52F1D
MELTPMDPNLLPPIAHASAEDVPLPHPSTFKAVRNQDNLTRPAHGLWCSPITTWSSEGAPTGTAWTDWTATPDDVTGQPSQYHDPNAQFTAVEPLPHAQIYLLKTADDLDRLVAAFPLPPDHQMRSTAPNWEAMAMAVAGWDAVYASKAGLAANAERFLAVEPSLYGWECPSVLWLRPAYRLTAR